MKNTIIFLGLLWVTLLPSAHAQLQPFTSYEIDKLLSNQYKADGTGAAVLVAEKGKIIYHKAFGMADLERNVPMQPDMVFRVGSITKQFTAIAILQLMEQGKLSLQDSITRFIPDYPMQGHTITIEHLLTHTSGIKSYTEMEDFESNMRKDMKPEELIAVFKNQAMDFAPGTQWKYNNSGYFLLGDIIEKVSGKTYPQYLEEVFFKPLGMTNSYYGNDTKIIKKRAAAYQKGENGVENADYMSMTQPYAAGSIQSTVEDLFRWHQAVHAHKLVKKETLDKAFTPYKLNNGITTDYGYGWSLGEVKGSPSIEHGGGINGFLTMEKYLPKEDVFVAVFSNCTCNAPDDAASRIAALVTEKHFFFQRPYEINLNGSGYALGLQHGHELKIQIEQVVAKWKKNVEKQMNKPADLVVREFFEYARFDDASKTWTPELYEEVRGIADGSGQAFNDIMALNLLDEFWVWQDAKEKHHCSGIGVPARNGNPAYIAQNMDLEGYTDGFQVLLHLAKTDKNPEQLILSHPGLIALNGLNEAGIGACMNTLMQLKGAPVGLPVAFVVRGILAKTDKTEVLNFIQTVPHASGQNYIIGIRDEVYDFEASANKVVRFDPQNANGTVYHTNHPIANDDLKDWYKASESGNSVIRLNSVQGRVAALPTIKDADLKAALRAKDDPNNPVCRTFSTWGGTFASVVMTLTSNPELQITAGPPDESEYWEVRFSTGKKLAVEDGWRIVRGTVVDEEGHTMIWASVRAKDPTTGTYTGDVVGFDGEYSLKVPLSLQELSIDGDAGFGTEIFPLTASDTLNVLFASASVNTFYLPKKTFQRTAPIHVSGSITGKNIAGDKYAVRVHRPSVRIEGTETRVYADANGRFDITVPPGSDVLSFESDNYPVRKVLLPNLDKVYAKVTLWAKHKQKKRH